MLPCLHGYKDISGIAVCNLTDRSSFIFLSILRNIIDEYQVKGAWGTWGVFDQYLGIGVPLRV